MSKRALITGITGQDGSYLAEFLLAKGYEVHGLARRIALEDDSRRLERIAHILPRLHLHSGSLESPASFLRIVEETQPDECYHLAAQSFVTTSFEDESSTLNINVIGTHHVLSVLKARVPSCKVYFAGSSEMFGRADTVPQNELTPFQPVSPYALSKVAGCLLTRYYREVERQWACVGILFNHESPRRGVEFVTRKISTGVAEVLAGRRTKLLLGNLDARRDWGHARDYVEAMWLMLQQPEPDDYVIATGEDHSVREFAELAFAYVGLDWQEYVEVNPAFLRRAEVHRLRGDYSKAAKRLGWQPRVRFAELVKEMVEADCRRLGVVIENR